jgi:hypothetical protein
MASSIFERLRDSFDKGITGPAKGTGTSPMPDLMSRSFGGNQRTGHPYVSGYWQIVLIPPKKIFDTHVETVQTWLTSAAEGFTPPTRTLNKADLPGQGGLGSSFITGQTLTRTFTVTFREYRDLPILTIFDLWTSAIDAHTGVSPLAGVDWNPSSYKGSCFVINTKPTQSLSGTGLVSTDIEQVYYFHGVFPESAPHDTFGQDIATNDVVQHSISFSFDGWPLTKEDPEVVNQALTYFSNADKGSVFDTTYNPYLKSVTSTTT